MLPGLLQGISRELGNGFKSFFKIIGLGCDAFQTLFLGIAGLGNGTVELVGAGCVIAFRLVIDLCRCA